MKEHISWTNNENNNGINPLTNREEIRFPKDEQEMFAKEYLHLAQKIKEINTRSTELVRKIDNTRAEFEVSPELNQKLLDVLQKELSENIEKEKSIEGQMSMLFEKMEKQTKDNYLTKNPEQVN